MDSVKKIIKEKLSKISDCRIQADIVRYISDLEFFNSKIGNYKTLRDNVPEVYRNLTIYDFVSLGDEELCSLLNIDKCDLSTVRNPLIIELMMFYNNSTYNNQLDNEIDNLKNDDNSKDYFISYVMNKIENDNELRKMVVALYSQDDDIKSYVKKRN